MARESVGLSLARIFLHGFELPWLTVLQKTASGYVPFLADGVSPIPIFCVIAVVLWLVWRRAPDMTVTVAVVGICRRNPRQPMSGCAGRTAGRTALRCSAGVRSASPGCTGPRARYPQVRMVANQGQRSPLELAARAVQEARGDLIS